MKKILSIILTLTVFLSVFTVVGAADEAVAEVPVSEQYISNTEMLKALGIGDFTAKVPTDKVTRGEFAQIIAGLLNGGDMQVQNLPFLDVDKQSEYYNAVCTVYAYGIMNGVSGTEFNPQGYITYEQAVKCMVEVLGYGDIAFTYPEGYINMALRIKILKNLGTNSDNFTWEKVLQLVINTFDVSLMSISSVGNDSVEYRPDDKATVLGVYHNIFKSKGKVTDNGITTITGQPVYSEDYMVINNIAGFITDDSLREYIGQTVEFYYQTETDGTRILYIFPNENSTDVLEIKADDLAIDLPSFTKTNVPYYVNGKKVDAKVNQYAEMIYNGKSFPTFLAKDMKIKAGTIKLIDNDFDSVYDLIIVDEYKDFIVTAVDTKDMFISDENGNIYSYNPEKVHAYLYNANLEKADIAEFVNGYIVSLSESKDGKYRKFVVSGKTATGVVDGFEEDEDGNVIISIEGAPYEYAPTFLENVAGNVRDEFIPKMGNNVKVYLNYEGTIASIDLAARDFLYAYCLAIAPKTGGMSNTVQLRVVTEKGDDIALNAAKEVEINGAKSKPADLLTIPAFENPKTGEFVPQLVRIKTNADGELKMITTATEQETTELGFSDKDTFTLATSYGAGSTAGRGYGTYYSTDSDTVYFRIAKPDNYHEPEVMAIKTKPSAYANMKIYDVDEFWRAGAMVFQDNDTYSNYMARIFIVTKVFTTFNANRQPVKAIRGYQQNGYWTYVEAEEGLIDHYIPEGIKIGDIVQVQVDDAKNLRTINKMFSLADKQTPVTSGAITSDGISYVYGYLCNKTTSDVVISMDNYALDATSNIQMRSVPTSAAILLFDAQEKTLRSTTLREIPINATLVNGRYEIIDENLMVFAKTARANATEFIFIKY